MMIFQETEKVELKRILNDTLPKEIVAFLNSFGGTIYIGPSILPQKVHSFFVHFPACYLLPAGLQYL